VVPTQIVTAKLQKPMSCNNFNFLLEFVPINPSVPNSPILRYLIDRRVALVGKLITESLNCLFNALNFKAGEENLVKSNQWIA